MDQFDAIVIGAGVVGLATARALALAGHEVLVLEAQRAFGQGVSSRNSEVVHAGLYYDTGSLKARLCVQGRERLYDYCEQRGVPHRKTGKLVVAVDSRQAAGLALIEARAAANGVAGLRRLGAREATAMEPALRCDSALWSPETGIVDSHALMLSLVGDIEANGGLLAFGSPFQDACLEPHGLWRVRCAEDTTLHCRWLVNAAGLQAQALAARIEGLSPAHIPPLQLARGHYFTLAHRAPFSHLIYPLPVDGGLGVHLTLDLGGQAKFGPDVEWVSDETYTVDPARAALFEAEVRRWWPGLPAGALQPGYAGIRPKLSGPGEPAQDFRLDGPARHGMPGLVNLFGIESPGLTASLAIGDAVLAELTAS
jgi:L-2-hydroxyglutarate oxidase LhgO